MSAFLYLLAYLAFIACVALIIMKVVGYLKKPLHLRWEIYPVPHETGGRAEYGGSYLENSDWYERKQEGSLVGTLTGFLKEALFLHATYEHNRELWYRTYPFHAGLYLLVGALGLTILCALMMLAGYTGGFFTLCANVAMVCNLVGFLAVLGGCLGLIQRRMTKPDLRKFSMPEHFFNLALFAVWAALGLIAMLTMSPRIFTGQSVLFFAGMLSFNTNMPINGLYALYLIISCIIFVWVPASFMAHAFMKYFTWHDIRWGDQPTQDNPSTQAKLGENLNRPISWSASHIGADGKKSWAEMATTPPPSLQKDKE